MDWERLRIGVGNFLSRNVPTQQDDEVTSCLQSKMADYARQVKKFKTRMIRMVKAMIVWSMGLALRSPPLYTPFLMKVSVREFLIWSWRHDLENTLFYSATWVVLESKHRECCCKSESVVVTFRILRWQYMILWFILEPGFQDAESSSSSGGTEEGTDMLLRNPTQLSAASKDD